VTKAHIISEIQRTASENGGVPMGLKTFEKATGISESSWRGRYWRNWGSALEEAGFAANSRTEAYELSFLIKSLIQLTRANGVFPTAADMRLARQTDKSFPGVGAFLRLGTVNDRVEVIRQYATQNAEFSDILTLLPDSVANTEDSVSSAPTMTQEGYVYMALLRVGREKRYKIGKAVLVGRRTDQLSIQLPEELELIHTIATDDPYGIEDYWHRRFQTKNTKGEWFDLSREDIQVFKKRRFM
jgi:hypothetical protein